MIMNLSNLLAELLYENDRVNVPGIGGFLLEYQPALVDQVQGNIQPPSKQVRFNPNLVLDDGALAAYVQRTYNLSLAEAERQVRAFTADIQERLDRRELVELSGVGRLYRNYENKLQFLPEGTNFDVTMFGLPTVAAQPVARHERLAAAAESVSTEKTTLPVSEPASPSWSSNLTHWLQHNLVLISVLTVVIVAIGLFLLSRTGEEAPTDVADEVPEGRLNVSPTDEEAEVELFPDREPYPEAAGEPRYAIIAVGLFASQANANRLVNRLRQAGYQPETEPETQGTRVGVRVEFEEDIELQRALEDIRRRFERTAFILEEDGVRVR